MGFSAIPRPSSDSLQQTINNGLQQLDVHPQKLSNLPRHDLPLTPINLKQIHPLKTKHLLLLLRTNLRKIKQSKYQANLSNKLSSRYLQ